MYLSTRSLSRIATYLLFAALALACLLGVGSVFLLSLVALGAMLVLGVLALRFYRPLVGPAWILGAAALCVLVLERAVEFGITLWLAVPLVVVIAAVAVIGSGFFHPDVAPAFGDPRKRLGTVADERAQVVDRRPAVLAERRDLAARTGSAFQERDPALADGFGRLDQPVPHELLDAARRAPRRSVGMHAQRWLLARHAADLVAEAVLRGEPAGGPVVAFDLEVVDHELLVDVGSGTDGFRPPGAQVDLATARVEACKRYLSVCVATLPVPLPFVSSLYAFELAYPSAPIGSSPWHGVLVDRPDGELTVATAHEDAPRREFLTEHPELAAKLLTVPVVRRAALAAGQPPFFVEGDRLVSAVLAGAGAPAATVESMLARLAEIRSALPWAELAAYRTPSDQSRGGRGGDIVHLTYPGRRGPRLERWWPTVGDDGLRSFTESHVEWAPPTGR